MKTLLALSLVIYFQTVTAGCPTREMIEFTYMTKDELIGFYCINKHHWTEDREKHDKWENNFNEGRAGGSYSDAKESLKMIGVYRDAMRCSLDNLTNAKRALRKDHGIEKEEDIKCE
jgi:hypothetical protein